MKINDAKDYLTPRNIAKFLFLIFVLPIFLIFFIGVIMRVGSQIFSIPVIVIDFKSVLNFGDYINYVLIIVTIEVTAIFSFAIWKSSEENNELTQTISLRDANREFEIVRESALIIYYDLIINFEILLSQYSNRNKKESFNNLYKLDLNKDFIKNIANLRNNLNSNEIDFLFKLYKDLQIIDGYDFTSEDKRTIEHIQSVMKRTFKPVLHNYLFMLLNIDTIDLFSSSYYIVLKKVQLISKGKSYWNHHIFSLNYEDSEQYIVIDDKLAFKGKFKNGKFLDGVEYAFNASGNKAYELEYVDSKIIKGCLYNESEKVFDCTFDENMNPQNGFITLYGNTNNLLYKGDIKNSEYNGFGIQYIRGKNGVITKEGIWVDGNFSEGEFKNSNRNANIQYFKGDYRDNRPYSGFIRCSLLEKNKDAYGFEGTLVEGKPYSGTGYVVYKKHIDEEYSELNPWDEFDFERDYDEDESYFDEIPPEVEEEMAKDNIRYQNKIAFDDLRENYYFVVELIKASWENGKAIKSENDLLNKAYFARGESKKK